MNTAEFNKSVDLYADAIYRFVRNHLRDEDEAHDIVQDVFEKTWLKSEEISVEKSPSC